MAKPDLIFITKENQDQVAAMATANVGEQLKENG